MEVISIFRILDCFACAEFLKMNYVYLYLWLSHNRVEDYLYYNLIKYIIPEIGVSGIPGISYHTGRRKAKNTGFLVSLIKYDKIIISSIHWFYNLYHYMVWLIEYLSLCL